MEEEKIKLIEDRLAWIESLDMDEEKKTWIQAIFLLARLKEEDEEKAQVSSASAEARSEPGKSTEP